VTPKQEKRTAHRCVHAPDIHKEREHGKVLRKRLRLVHLVLKRLGGLGRAQDGLDVEVAESELALALRITVGVGEDGVIVGEDGVEDIILYVHTGEWFSISAFERHRPSWQRTGPR
jgi:hypothetical protein